MKKLLFLLAACLSINAIAIPTISMPDMTVEQQTAADPDADNPLVNKTVVKTMPKFTADIRGALIKSGNFKVIDVSQAVVPATLPGVVAGKNFESKNLESRGFESYVVAESLPDNPIARNLAVNQQAAKPDTDYFLIGQINYIGENEDSHPIKQTNNMTKQYVVEVAAQFKLVRAKDNTIMANFSSNGRASDVKIISTLSQENAAWHHNVGKLVGIASKDLAANVVLEMESQFNFTLDNEEKARKAGESVVVTDVQVYN